MSIYYGMYVNLFESQDAWLYYVIFADYTTLLNKLLHNIAVPKNDDLEAEKKENISARRQGRVMSVSRFPVARCRCSPCP
jgi:hypothetical protein